MEHELTNQWLQKAKEDYISAAVLIEKVVPPQIEIACTTVSNVRKCFESVLCFQR